MADIRITDILQNEHIDFLEFCLDSNKRYRSELVEADYVAFCERYGITNKNIAQLRILIESYEQKAEFDSPGNDGDCTCNRELNQLDDVARKKIDIIPSEGEVEVPVATMIKNESMEFIHDNVSKASWLLELSAKKRI